LDFKAVLFDLDGTLLDTLADIAECSNAVLRSQGHPAHPLAAYRQFVGDGVEQLARRALPETHRTPAAVAACAAEISAAFLRHGARTARPYAGIPELLDHMSGLGLRLAILTNKTEEPARLMVSQRLNRWPFALVRGAREGVPKKPDPSAALAIAGRLNIPPRQFLYLGDTAIDMQTARGAGMFGLGVLWGFRAAPELIAGGARMLVRHPADLLQWL
jgi:phosphoglycolate phosphatase